MDDMELRDALMTLAEHGIPETMDLTPRLRSTSTTKGETALGRSGRGRGFLIALIALAATAFFLVPETQTAIAAIGRAIQSAGLVLLSSPSYSEVQEPSARPLPTPVASESSVPLVSLEDAQRRVGFKIRQPRWLPDGLVLVAVRLGPVSSTEPSPLVSSVVLSYGYVSPREGSGLFLQISPAGTRGGYVVPADVTEVIQLKAGPAIFARGAWDETQTWNPNADAGLLSWETDGLNLVLSYSGLTLDLSEVVRIADSVQ